ncbi:MAG: hypothetical protein ACQ9MH_11245 [Nitrospinales bacterium]
MNVASKETIKTTADWAVLLRDGVIDQNLNDDIANCLVKHLADLGILKIADEDLWKFTSDNKLDSEESIKNDFTQKFDNARQSEPGSLLKYFTGETLNEKDFQFPKGDTSKAEVGKDKKISSNLSNFQIVRKMGRQLSPFIELENNIISQLEGTHVTKIDAKILFKYILNRIQAREKPREWEQISRRRHK